MAVIDPTPRPNHVPRTYKPTPAPVLGNDGLDGLTGANRDAAVLLSDLFKSYGLESLVPDIINYIKGGYSADTVSVMLQDTEAYRKRFKANDVRRQKGLPVLSPAEYLATESAYRQTLSKWGLPVGFYDSPNDFQKFLENDLSPVELNDRAQAASDFMNQADSNQMAYYRKFYTQGDLVAFALDPQRAAPLVGKAFQASRIGGTAADQGVAIDQQTAEALAGMGVSQQDAQQGFGLVATNQPILDKLGSIYGGGVSQDELIQATFAGDAAANQKVKKLASQERATFGGTAGINQVSLQTDRNVD